MEDEAGYNYGDDATEAEPEEAEHSEERFLRRPQLLPSTFIKYLVRTVEELHSGRPKRLHTQARGRLAQFWYGTNRTIHYEVWLHERTAQLEIGLHLEASPETNQALYREFDKHLVEIQAELGPAFWLEDWDHGWVRLYETQPLRPLDLDRVEDVAARVLA